MGFGSMWHWLIVIAVVAVLFGGRGKIANVMGDFAKGIKAFKTGMKDDEAAANNIDKPAQVSVQSTPAPSVVGESVQKSG